MTNRGSYLFDIDIVGRAENKVNRYYGNFFHYKVAAENQSGDLQCTNFFGLAVTNHNANAIAQVIDAPGNLLKIQATGEANDTIHWVATVRATELVKP